MSDPHAAERANLRTTSVDLSLRSQMTKASQFKALSSKKLRIKRIYLKVLNCVLN